MAEALTGPAIDQVVKLVGPPIKRQFNYLCCFTANINNLEQEAKRLDDAEGGLQVKIGAALNDVQIIAPEVETWLAESKKIKDEKTAILDQVPNVGSVCLKLRARFSLSKTAVKTADRMKELREECNKFDVISLPGPPPAREAVPLKDAYEFKSRKQIEEDIMTVLRGGDVSVIGIYGMGGLGKTTMANRIRNRALKEHVFEETAFAVISQQVDKHKIQLEISGWLGLKLEEAKSEAIKSQKLHARLSGTKRILLVLDDVWKPIELEEFGIPRDSKGCTILITSRDRDALHRMDVQLKFGMEILSDEDARILFRKKAGTCMDEAEFKSIAEGIVKKCEGLPIALATVGAALKDKSKRYWSNALRELNQRVPDHIEDYIVKVYNPLKLSYDFLSSKQDKSIFLLCCLFPEDAYIYVDQLTYFGMGLGIFEGIQDLEDVRDSVTASIMTLRGRSLLLEGEERDDHVRMHDVVRDVCKIIATEKKYIGGNDCRWISSFKLAGERTELPTGLGSQNLHLLFLSRYIYSREEDAFRLDSVFVEMISDLHVLWIQGYMSLTSLPLTHSLKNLKSLVLRSCHGLETISAVGEFVNLEILICTGCPLIKELPLETKRLNRLKLLDLTGCRNLQRIGQGIISSLFRLEELKMSLSFKRWESEDREERENVGIRELESLINLRCLVIEIEDPALAEEKVHLSSKINRFCISIGAALNNDVFDDYDDDSDAPFYEKKMSYEKTLVLGLKGEEPCLRNSIGLQLLRDTEYLSGNGANSMDLAKCQNIRWLGLERCETVKNTIATSMVDDTTVVLASLEHLNLRFLPKLLWICDGPISYNSFHNLKELNMFHLEALKQLWKSVPPHFTNLSSIKIDECHQLCNLGHLPIAGKDCFPQLEKLVIRECEMMEQVFLWNKEGESNNHHCITKVFPKLKEVYLSDLPNLATFHQGTCGIEFPLLKSMSIWECPKMEYMASNNNTGGSSADNDDDSFHLFCQPKKVSFGLKELSLEYQWNPFCGHKIPLSLLNGLELLTLYDLKGCTSLFPSSVAENLVNLRRLEITQCDEMLKVIEDNKEEEEEEKVVSGTTELPLILFPKLEGLSLCNLSKLVTFCERKCEVKLPLLMRVTIWRCPDMENWSLGFLAAPSLEAFKTDFNNNLEIGANVNYGSHCLFFSFL